MKLYTSLYVVFLAWIFAEAKTSRGGQISNGQTSRGQNSSRLNNNLKQSIKQEINRNRGTYSAAITSSTFCKSKPANGTKFKNVCWENVEERDDFAKKYCTIPERRGVPESVGQNCPSANKTNAKFQQCYNPGE